VVGGEQRIRATLADQQISGYLNIPEGYPVLHLERKMETNRSNFVFYSSIFCETGNFYLEGTF
jgi:GntR family transcriptional regulator/GntR family frlABCD operon transcriptional regulator